MGQKEIMEILQKAAKELSGKDIYNELNKFPSTEESWTSVCRNLMKLRKYRFLKWEQKRMCVKYGKNYQKTVAIIFYQSLERK